MVATYSTITSAMNNEMKKCTFADRNFFSLSIKSERNNSSSANNSALNALTVPWYSTCSSCRAAATLSSILTNHNYHHRRKTTVATGALSLSWRTQRACPVPSRRRTPSLLAEFAARPPCPVVTDLSRPPLAHTAEFGDPPVSPAPPAAD